MELKDTWIDQKDEVDKAGADVINEIAQAVIQIETNKTTSISEKPSNIKYPTEKAVADYVNEHGGGGSIDIIDNLTSTDKDKALSANMGRELFNTIGSVATSLQNEITEYDKNKVDKEDGKGLSEILDIVYDSYNPVTGAEESSLNIIYQGGTRGTSITFYNKKQIDEKIGDVETALDSIIAIQNELLGVSE